MVGDIRHSTDGQGSAARAMSHGRGGAGNIAQGDRRSSMSKPEDLVTPTIKSQLYTTGRGGSGNMAKNDPAHPEIARAAQDVEAPAHAHREPEGNFHFGRGGAANVTKLTDDEALEAKRHNEQRTSGELERERAAHGGEREDVRGLGDKAKDLLGKIGGKK
ncbi:hypothetical protein IWX49DRAFT_302346 [Phyllosticta citricarpa]|uniref:Uncharacterized protein n=2 Tax=Phyllosticta TaxID=121621 RepID=A0ABR1LKV0_9PEZI